MIPALFVVLATACSSTPVEIPQGSRVWVRLYEASTGTLLELANQTHPDLAGIYSTERTSASLKLAPEAMLGALLAELDAAGFSRLAVEGPPQSGAVRGWLVIETDGATRSLAIAEGELDPERLSAFATMKLSVIDLYQKVGSLQYIRNPDGPQLFDPLRPPKRDTR